jgi:protease-4
VAASGGYYVSAPAERIYANADTLTGSLGVIVSLLNYEETFDMIGLRQIIFKSGEFKDIGSPVRELSEEERDILQGIVDQAYEGFVDVIVEGRDLPRDEVLDLADGRIYTGQQALEVGLVDELGNLDSAIAGARELAGLDEDALVVRYNTTPDFLDLLRGSLESSQQPADPLMLRELSEPQAPRLEYRMVP